MFIYIYVYMYYLRTLFDLILCVYMFFGTVGSWISRALPLRSYPKS